MASGYVRLAASQIERLQDRLVAYFVRLDREMTTGDEMKRHGFDRAEIARAVRIGILRKGTVGYWLPAGVDAGAAAVMEAAMKGVI